MKNNRVEENLKTISPHNGPLNRTDKIKIYLSLLYSNVKMHLDPDYQAASALVLNRKVTPYNLEYLINVSEGKEVGSTYNKNVLDYAKKILSEDAKYNEAHNKL